MKASLFYFFITDTIPLVALSLSMFGLSGIVICEQIRSEKENGRPKSKPYFYFFLCSMIFQPIVTVMLIVSGNFTLTI